jgi:hypothetical protein
MRNREKINLNSSEIHLLTLLYFIVGLAEVIAEFYTDNLYIYLLKPLLIPLLALIYWKSSKNKNSFFLGALFFAFLANIFFISKSFDSILIAVIFFAFYRIIIIYLVIRLVKVKNYLPVLLGCIPFMAIFVYVTILTMNELNNGLYIYIMQVIMMTFLGGFSLANYIVDKNKMNYWLLMSCLLFTILQFVFTIRLYYMSIYIFQPLAMILYIFAQYFLCKFILLSEEKRLKL